jgi:hypothetical protein
MRGVIVSLIIGALALTGSGGQDSPSQNDGLKPAFKASFESSANADFSVSSKEAETFSGGKTAQLSKTGQGFNGGRAAVFARDNTADFKDIAEAVNEKMWSFRYKADNVIDPKEGVLRMRVKPFLNQIQPYPDSSQNDKLYYFVSARDESGKYVIAVYIANKALKADFYSQGARREDSVTAGISSWRPGEWHTVEIQWSEKRRLLLVDGQQAGECDASGPLKKASALEIGGVLNGCSAQGLIDGVEIFSGKPQAPAAPAAPAASKTEILNIGFESGSIEPEWEISFKDSAEGSYSVSTEKSHEGKTSLKITKSNALGYVDIKCKTALKTEPGNIYQAECWYNSQNLNLDNIGAIRIDQGGGRGVNYDDAVNRGEGWTTCSQIVNSSPFRWNKTLCFFTPSGSGKDKYLHFLLYGNPCEINLDDFKVSCRPGLKRATGETPTGGKRPGQEELIPEALMSKILDNRTDARIEIKKEDRYPRLYINGEFYPLVINHPCWELPMCRYGSFGRAGIKLQMLSVLLGGSQTKSPFCNIFPEKGKYNFQAADEAFKRLLMAAPDAYIILNFTCLPYKNWGDDTPGEAYQNIKGERAVSKNLTYEDYWSNEKKEGEYWMPSYYSKSWREEVGKCISEYIRHLRTTPYFKTVAGFYIMGGMDYQFMLRRPDYSPAAKSAFTEWIRKKYNNSDKELRAAWADSSVSFDSFDLPELKFDRDSEKKFSPTFLDPAKDRKTADFRLHRIEGVMETLDYFGKTVEDAMGKFVLGFVSAPNNYSSYVSYVSRSKYIQAVSPQPWYPLRRAGYVREMMTMFPDSMSLHGRFVVDELDLRTYSITCYSMPSDLSDLYVGFAWDKNEFKTINRKHAGYQIARNMGFWYYDMDGSYFNTPELLDEIKFTNNVACEIEKELDNFRPDVAVFSDAESETWNRKWYILTHAGAPARYLMTSGVPYDNYLINDLFENKELLNYKVYIFLNSCYMTEKQRKFIDDNLKKDNKIIVWLYGDGFLTPEGLSSAAMKNLTGFNTVYQPEPRAESCVTVKSGDRLASGLLPVIGLADSFRQACNYIDKEGSSWYNSRFYIDDKDAVILAKYQDDGKDAIGVKRFANWTSVYSGPAAALSDRLLSNIAKEAGAYIFSEPGLSSYIKGNFASIHAIKGGSYSLKFPCKGRIIDLNSGDTVADGTDTMSISIDAGETRWYRLVRQ